MGSSHLRSALQIVVVVVGCSPAFARPTGETPAVAADPSADAMPSGAVAETPIDTPPIDTTPLEPSSIAAPPVEAVPVASPAPVELGPSAPAAARVEVRRVALQDVDTDGQPRLGLIVTNALATELRKLVGISVISMVEVRSLLEHESSKQLAGCDEQSCLSEIAEALGAEIVMNLSIQTLGDERLVMLRMHHTAEGSVATAARRVPLGDDQRLLGVVGELVAELLPDTPLRAGQKRGVSIELARRLNPPPLSPVVVAAVGSVGAVGLIATLGLTIGSVLQRGAADALLRESTSTVISGAELQEAHTTAESLGTGALVVGGFTLATAIGAASLFPLTDFEPPASSETP